MKRSEGIDGREGEGGRGGVTAECGEDSLEEGDEEVDHQNVLDKEVDCL